MSTTITDSKFADLKNKLRELFELDKSDLDFGIYRIMAAKNKEVTAFLDRQLRDVVREILDQHGAGESDKLRHQLDEAISHAKELGADPDSLPKIQQLKAQLTSTGTTSGGASGTSGASGGQLEADIYNHLLAFFSRYYDEGDFISKRRYKGDTYAIPYNGEEVTLHWANKDQYYIKSGEWHKDYRFSVTGTSGGTSGGGKSVRFQLVEASQVTNNNKERDDSKRRYILASENPIHETASELTLRFEFRVPTDKDRQQTEGAVAIFGGKFATGKNPKKGDEREQFCADAEKRAVAALSTTWLKRVASTSTHATETKPARTLLGKHIDTFTARNTFDYFIHKDLGGFLKRELDFYIKNEVVRLDDLENLPADYLVKVQGKVKAIRTVATSIIDFLAAIENFQKKLWLKKKFVLNTNWLVTLDRIPAKLRDTVAANDAQWAEWEQLGFKPETPAPAPGSPESGGQQSLLPAADWHTRAYLEENDKLIVDTRFFDPMFKADVLASEDVRKGASSLDESQTGVLNNGDNFQALNLLQKRYSQQIKCVYIDPPYNTQETGFAYKNNYRHSSWLSMIIDRLGICWSLLGDQSVIVTAIDDQEATRLDQSLDACLGPETNLGCLVVETKPSGRTNDNFLATSHEYYYMRSKKPKDVGICFFPLTEKERNKYAEGDSNSAYKWRDFLRTGGFSTPQERPNSFYPIYYDEKTGQIALDPFNDAVEIIPIDRSGKNRVWRKTRPSFLAHLKANEIQIKKRSDCTYKVEIIDRIKDGTRPKSVWVNSKYDAASHGTKLLKSFFDEDPDFAFPKSIWATQDVLYTIIADTTDGLILDYFAGSGTTGHAVINLNREDNGNRKFILVEMGAYFHTVLKPRITKVLYSPQWKDGKAQVHGQGTSALVKYFALESYEDALNNLPTPTGDLLAGADEATQQAMIAYSLDLEMGPNLLDLDAFADPWGYTINAQLAGEDAITPHAVDLMETFNYLLGLKVHSYGPIEKFTAEFERAAHEDGMGRLKIKGKLRRDMKKGTFVFQRVEGELLDGTRILVIWRKLPAPGSQDKGAPARQGKVASTSAEQDAAVLDAWMARHGEQTKERSEHRDYHQIYINGPVTLEQPTAEIRTVMPIEQTFRDRMFEDCDEGGML